MANGGGDAFEGLKKELPHIIVLILLVLVLLVILTKFQWIHCSQVPGDWCNIYCNVIMRSHSRVALLYADDGIGDPAALQQAIRRARVSTYLEPFDKSEASIGLLKGYDLVILEKMRKITFKEASALEEYLNGGGTLLWIGDSASSYYMDDVDLAESVRTITDAELARAKAGQGDYAKLLQNQTEDEVRAIIEKEYSTQKALEQVNKTRGFGSLENILLAKYVGVRTANASSGLLLKNVVRDHLIMQGVRPEFPIGAKQFTEVTVNPSGVTLLAVLKQGSKEYPAIFETKYVGRIIYFAFPLEDSNSTTLLTNVLDYLVTC